MGTLSHSCLRGSEPEHRVRNRMLTRWPTGIVLRHPTVTSSHNGSLQRKEGTLLAHQLGTCHHPPFWHSSLLTHHYAQHGVQRSHNPALCHQQHPRWRSHSEREHLLFPRQNCLSSITRQHHTAVGTGGSQPVSTIQHHGSSRMPGPWPPGLGAGGKGAGNLSSSENSPGALLSHSGRVFFSWGYWDLLSLGASCNGKIFVVWLRFRMPEATGPVKGEKRD